MSTLKVRHFDPYRKSQSARIPSTEWGKFKPAFAKCLSIGLTYAETLDIMQRHFNFSASIDQFKAQLKKWEWTNSRKPTESTSDSLASTPSFEFDGHEQLERLLMEHLELALQHAVNLVKEYLRSESALNNINMLHMATGLVNDKLPWQGMLPPKLMADLASSAKVAGCLHEAYILYCCCFAHQDNTTRWRSLQLSDISLRLVSCTTNQREESLLESLMELSFLHCSPRYYEIIGLQLLKLKSLSPTSSRKRRQNLKYVLPKYGATLLKRFEPCYGLPSGFQNGGSFEGNFLMKICHGHEEFAGYLDSKYHWHHQEGMGLHWLENNLHDENAEKILTWAETKLGDRQMSIQLSFQEIESTSLSHAQVVSVLYTILLPFHYHDPKLPWLEVFCGVTFVYDFQFLQEITLAISIAISHQNIFLGNLSTNQSRRGYGVVEQLKAGIASYHHNLTLWRERLEESASKVTVFAHERTMLGQYIESFKKPSNNQSEMEEIAKLYQKFIWTEMCCAIPDEEVSDSEMEEDETDSEMEEEIDGEMD